MNRHNLGLARLGVMTPVALATLLAAMWRGAAQANRGPSNYGAEHRLPLSFRRDRHGAWTGVSGDYKESLDLIADHSNFGF